MKSLKDILISAFVPNKRDSLWIKPDEESGARVFSPQPYGWKEIFFKTNKEDVEEIVRELVTQTSPDMAASSDELGYIKNKVGGYKIYVPNEDIDLDISGYWYDGDELSVSISTLLEKGLPQSVIDAIKAKGASCSFNGDGVHITGHAHYYYYEDVSDIMFVPDTHEDFQYTYITIDNMCEGGDVDGEAPYTIIPLPAAYVPSKQDKLVSGQNIKTINNTSILGSGNIDVQSDTEIFWVTYGTTSYDAIDNAFEHHKIIMFYDELRNTLFHCKGTDAGTYVFRGETSKYLSETSIRPNNTWTEITDIEFEVISNKVTAITSSVNNDQYPGAKAVYDFVRALADANNLTMP